MAGIIENANRIKANLEATYSAIEAKGGARPSNCDGLTQAIQEIPIGSGESIPAKELLDSLTIADGESISYLVYDGTLDEYNRFASFRWTTTSGQYIVDKGEIINGEFIAKYDPVYVDSNTNFLERYDATDGFIVYRITPATSGEQVRNVYCYGTTSTIMIGETEVETTVNLREQGLVAARCGGTNWTTCRCFGTVNSVSLKFLKSIDMKDASGTFNNDNWSFSGLRNLRYCRLGNFKFTGTWDRAFYYDTSLYELDLSLIDLTECTGLTNDFFNGAVSLKRLIMPLIATASLKTFNIGNMQNIESLNLTPFKECELTSASFSNLYLIRELDTTVFKSIEGNNAARCQSLNSARKINVSNVTGVTSLQWFVYNATSLEEVIMPSDLSAVTSTQNAFYQCTSLKRIVNCSIPISFSLSNCTLLSEAALVEIFEALPIVDETQTLTLASACKARLTDDDIAIATEKNWTIA